MCLSGYVFVYARMSVCKQSYIYRIMYYMNVYIYANRPTCRPIYRER